MTYQVVVSRKFDRRFSNLSREVQDRIVEKLKALQERPELGKPLKGKLRGLRSLRVGKYRIIYQVDEDSKVVRIITVGRREEVYERF
ncbi:MAG: mRNA-degrading endonuclease RelE [Candidatus Alkanophagales archaeon MCA70_species_2]|nr:mRNA-degrading endonuclease RelE [Candidatus Alkanophaga liquidiphilum]